MLFKKKTFFLTLLFLILLIAGCRLPGCGAENENSEGNTENENEIPEEITEIESISLDIMYQADLIPLVELVSQQSGENTEAGEQEADEQQENDEEPEDEEDQEVELTFEKTILGEVLRKELDIENNEDEENNQLSRNTEEIWDNIKISVTELHNRWDELEPKLIQENINPDTIDSFEESLENLTIIVSEQNYFGTLTAANELTYYLAIFMIPFTENTIATLNELKYHTRNIVLSAAADNYEEAQNSLNYMKEQNLSITSALEDENNFEDLDTSLDNLQRALDKQDIGLIDIKAAIVMEELIQIMKDLEKVLE